jgi:acetylornithine/N-succinyldiaminopimelate aminotransferase
MVASKGKIMNIQEIDQTYMAHTYNRVPLTLTEGHGSLVEDENGKTYIDLGSGIAVNIFGAADPGWVAAVEAQLHKLQHTSNYYYSEPMAQVARMLCERTDMKKVFCCNSGAEANECAIKTARKYSFDRYGEGRHNIITLKNGFHGRTITTLAATGQDSFHTYFGPFTEGFRYVTPGDQAELEAAVDDSVCAIMMELIQGEGGVNVLDQEYVALAAKLAKEKDVLLIIDEVQTGNGRTGSLYAYMQYGIEPDIVTTAKGLAGGLPFGAILFGEKTKEVLTPGTHGSTFGGNPVSAAGAVYVLSHLDDAMMTEVSRKGAYIKKELEACSGVEEVTGMGLMIGIKCKKNLAAAVAECREKGVLVLTAHEKMRLLPPLNIPDQVLEQAIHVIKEVLEG